jgi:cytochrome c
MRILAPALFFALLSSTFLFPRQSKANDPQLAEQGRFLFEKRCGGCHSPDRDKEGPRLRAVYGRPAASVATFKYSDALKKTRPTWDAATLDKWLAGPESLVPGTDMEFRVENSEERARIIAYLKTLAAK